MSASPSPPDRDRPVVRLDRVSVSYGARPALAEVSAELPPGAVGLLGPNGAGKSTLLRALLGFVRPTAGRIEVLGLDVAARARDVRARIGFMPERDGHIAGMSAVMFVAYCGQLSGLPRVDATRRAHDVLHYVGLGEARYRNVDTFSTGMKQRIKLAQALVHDPDLLLLDEPTNGLDPRGREDLLALIRDLAGRKGVSLLLSSHLLPDVEATCEHVLVLDRGRLAASGTIAALRAPAGRTYEVRIKGDVPRFVAALRDAGLDCDDSGEELLRVLVPGEAGAPGADQRHLCAVAETTGAQVRHLRPATQTLEDVFTRAVAP